MKSKIISGSPVPYVEPFTFPGVFRSKNWGGLWLAETDDNALRLTPPNQCGSSAMPAGERCILTITPLHFEQVTQPTTIGLLP